MGKRSSYQRRAADKYLTPYAATLPLVPFVKPGMTFIEPCAGDGRLVRHMERHGLTCVGSWDTEPDSLMVRYGNALTEPLPQCDVVIANFPWSRHLLHPMIDRYMRHTPTWSLHDADWAYTLQHGEVPRLLRHCTHIVAMGRVKWIEDSPHSAVDNCAWYRFDVRHMDGPRFVARSG